MNSICSGIATSLIKVQVKDKLVRRLAEPNRRRHRNLFLIG
jgi:hypothetical protein